MSEQEKTLQELFEESQNGGGNFDGDNGTDSIFEFPEDVSKIKFGDEEFDVDSFKKFVSLGKETNDFMEKNKPQYRELSLIEADEKKTREDYEKDGQSLFNEFMLKAGSYIDNYQFDASIKPEDLPRVKSHYKEKAKEALLEGYKTGKYKDFNQYLSQDDAIDLDQKIKDMTGKYGGKLEELKKEKDGASYKGNVDKFNSIVEKFEDKSAKELINSLIPEFAALNVSEDRIKEIVTVFNKAKAIVTETDEEKNKRDNDAAKKALMATSVGKTNKVMKQTPKVSLDNVSNMSVDEIDSNLSELYKQFKQKR